MNSSCVFSSSIEVKGGALCPILPFKFAIMITDATEIQNQRCWNDVIDKFKLKLKTQDMPSSGPKTNFLSLYLIQSCEAELNTPLSNECQLETNKHDVDGESKQIAIR